MKPVKYASVRAALDDIQPLGDFVLVRRLPDDDAGHSLIIKPQIAEGKYVEPPRRGLVLATGPGDKVTKCAACEGKGASEDGQCGACAGLGYPADARHPMHVQAGDTVLYWRAPANNIEIDGDEFTFLHEEMHVLAVLEP